MPNTCCRHCRPPAPPTGCSCTANQTCITFTNGTSSCVRFQALRARIVAKAAQIVIGSLSCDTIKLLVLTVLRGFCNRDANQVRCQNFIDADWLDRIQLVTDESTCKNTPPRGQDFESILFRIPDLPSATVPGALGRILFDALVDAQTSGGDIAIGNPPACTNTNIPNCAENVSPVIDPVTNCPSCRPQCSSTQRAACGSQDALPPCAVGTAPEIKDCCLTCKAPPPPACSDSDAANCRQKIEKGEVPTCPEGVTGVFNAEKCCISCVQPKPVTPPTCNRDNVERCINSSRVCADGEKPVLVNGTCCLSCRPPQALCTPEQVVRCIASSPVCGADEKPTAVQGQCCLSCRFPLKACDPGCAATEFCFHKKNATTGLLSDAGVCVPRRFARLVLRAVSDACRDNIKNWTCSDAQAAVREILRRFCALYPSRCEKFLDRLETIVVENVGSTCNLGADPSRSGEEETVVLSAGEPADVPESESVTRTFLDAFNDALASPCWRLFVRAVCRTNPREVPECQGTERPVYNATSGCFTCFPPNGRPDGDNCTKADFEACNLYVDRTSLYLLLYSTQLQLVVQR